MKEENTSSKNSGKKLGKERLLETRQYRIEKVARTKHETMQEQWPGTRQELAQKISNEQGKKV